MLQDAGEALGAVGGLARVSCRHRAGDVHKLSLDRGGETSFP